MTPQPWHIQGWAELTLEQADALIRQAGHPPMTVAAGDWVRPVFGRGAAAVVVATAAVPATVWIIPGSQELDLRAFSSAAAIALPLEPGMAMAIDARLSLRAEDCVSLRLITMEEEARAVASEELALWHSRGFAFMRGALSSNRVAGLRAALDLALETDIAAWGEARLRAMGQFGALRNLSDMGAEFLDLLEDSPAYKLVNQILSPGYILNAFDALVLYPGEGRYPWDFHTDLQPLEGASFPRDRTLAVNVLYFLDASTAENGATWLVPHSHLCTLRAPPMELLARHAIPAKGEAGDILLFDSRLWHCAGTNNTTAPRRLIKTLFAEPWIRPALDYRRALSAGKWNDLSAFVRGLLGERASPPTSVVEYRSFLEVP